MRHLRRKRIFRERQISVRYWNFDEAIAAKRIEKGICSLESAFDALRQELNFHNNEKASKWKQVPFSSAPIFTQKINPTSK